MEIMKYLSLLNFKKQTMKLKIRAGFARSYSF